MTNRRKNPSDSSLADMLMSYLEKAQFEADLDEVMTSPHIAEHAKRLIREMVGGPVAFERAVELIAESPLLQPLAEMPQMMHQGGSDPMIIFQATMVELVMLVQLSTREGADMSRLIEAAKSNPLAFDACHALWQSDQRREGLPNWQLRRWGASGPTRPTQRKRKSPKLGWRDAALTLLIAEAYILGFKPYKNSATGGSSPSGCEVVQRVLSEVGLPAPTIPALEHIWKTNRGRIRWLASESSS